MILVLDNYDSFVHNLARLVRLAGEPTRVVRSDAITVDEIADLGPTAILLSPGPGEPAKAGCTVNAVRRYSATTPILGVCLGHQAIVEAFGGRVARAPEPRHGRTSLVRHDADGLFAGLPTPLRVCRYHSLAVDTDTLPDSLRVTARSDDGVVMAVAHREHPVLGVQFHPEAILTECGQELIDNFVANARQSPRR